MGTLDTQSEDRMQWRMFKLCIALILCLHIMEANTADTQDRQVSVLTSVSSNGAPQIAYSDPCCGSCFWDPNRQRCRSRRGGRCRCARREHHQWCQAKTSTTRDRGG